VRTRMTYMRGTRLGSESMNVVGGQEAPSVHAHAVGQKGVARGHEPPPALAVGSQDNNIIDDCEMAVLS
jgi:hypothetical protein